MPRAFAGLIAFTWALVAGTADVRAQTVILVRHAEKAAEPAADPSLTPAGRARAEALATALRGARVFAIVTSTLARTRETAAPLARTSGVSVIAVPISDGEAQHVAAVAALVRKAPKDASVVVVGHSNTIPAIARALGHVAAAPIADCRYDTLQLIRLHPFRPLIVEATYGSPSTGC